MGHTILFRPAVIVISPNVKQQLFCSINNESFGFLSMAEEEESSSEVNRSDPPPFIEVTCKSSGRISRFAEGTNAGFAVSLINRKLDNGAPLALHVEAVREGEEPISFGPNALLANFRNGWKLQTVTEADYGGLGKAETARLTPKRVHTVQPNSGSAGYTKKDVVKLGVSRMYIAKILFAFVLMFVLGGFLTLALENLPAFLLYINSSI